jgi:hypothetical protein
LDDFLWDNPSNLLFMGGYQKKEGERGLLCDHNPEHKNTLPTNLIFIKEVKDAKSHSGNPDNSVYNY